MEKSTLPFWWFAFILPSPSKVPPTFLGKTTLVSRTSYYTYFKAALISPVTSPFPALWAADLPLFSPAHASLHPWRRALSSSPRPVLHLRPSGVQATAHYAASPGARQELWAHTLPLQTGWPHRHRDGPVLTPGLPLEAMVLPQQTPSCQRFSTLRY